MEMNLPKRSEIKKTYRPELSESVPEYELYHELLKIGLRGEKQYPIGKYFADIAFSNARVVIEYDGELHLSRKEYDNERDEFLKKNSWIVVRVNKHDNFKESIKYIRSIIFNRDSNFILSYSSERENNKFVRIGDVFRTIAQEESAQEERK